MIVSTVCGQGQTGCEDWTTSLHGSELVTQALDFTEVCIEELPRNNMPLIGEGLLAPPGCTASDF
jgi:hypothetical protein